MLKNKTGNIRSELMKAMSILVAVSTLCITAISIAVNVRIDIMRIDENLENIAQAVAQSQLAEKISEDIQDDNSEAVINYLDTLKKSLSNIDVISVIDCDNIRRYHSNPEYIGTLYDGTIPDFSSNELLYVTSDTGPSGSQRRAYAAIYDEKRNYSGFVLAVILTQNIRHRIIMTIIIHLVCAVFLIILSVILSGRLADSIKMQLLGYEPEKFSAMYSLRNNILESLEEGIIEFDTGGNIIYMNSAAEKMYGVKHEENMKAISEISNNLSVVLAGEKVSRCSVCSVNGADILADSFPVYSGSEISGGLCILRDRTEFTKLMEDLSGVRYLVESMRANNHDFTNKLHVILGLIHMGETQKACEYISNITSIQQKLIHNIMKNIEDPSIAALLIGKYARSAELDIKFSLETGSRFSKNDVSLPSGDMVTVIGNLIENAMDSVNEKDEPPKEISVGIFTAPGTLIINTDDTGSGISEENIEKIYENGFTTKGTGHGTGLYQVKNIVCKYNGTITADSEKGLGTSFSVVLKNDGGNNNV